jgi:hypothetical protein
MKQYLLAVNGLTEEAYSESTATPEMDQIYADVEAFNEKLRTTGAWVFGGGLEAPSTASVVRVTDGEALVTDGPYAEAREQLGGFWVVKAPDLDAALDHARQAAAACRMPIEVRPFQPDEAEG